MKSLEDYIKTLRGRLSPVKKRILERLWAEGQGFPRGWVESSELLSLTNQKYFDRRIRELRDETGCDIESRVVSGNHAYRLRSRSLLQANPRLYLSSSQKTKLFEESGFRCAVCGAKLAPGPRGLQADHKVPLKRGGTNSLENWQALCSECNIAKRRACAGCEEDCLACSWAFPESSGLRLFVHVPPDLEQMLATYMERSGQDINTSMIEALRSFLKSQGPKKRP